MRWVILPVVLACAAWIAQNFFKPVGNPTLPSCEAFPALCGEASEGEPTSKSEGEFNVGRWSKAATSLENMKKHKSAAERFFQLKQWSYLSVSTEKFHLAITPAQFNYIEDVYVSVVDKASQKLAFEYHWQFPSLRLKLSPESVTGCSRFAGGFSGNQKFDLCYFDGAWHLDVDMSGLQANVKIEPLSGEALALWYPLGSDTQRPAYVHKESGMHAHGTITVGNSAPHSFTTGTAGIDWTLTFALRETRWRWVSLTQSAARVSAQGRPDALRRIGINLSNLVYDVTKGGALSHSAENALWVDGKLFLLPVNVNITIPSSTTADWLIQASDKRLGVDVDLVFTPHGLREDHSGHRALGIVSDFVQPFGCFRGTVSVQGMSIAITDAYGVCENHHAIW